MTSTFPIKASVRLGAVSLAFLSIAACGNESEYSRTSAPAPMAVEGYSDKFSGEADQSAPSPEASPSSAAMLAYSYSMGITAPKYSITGLVGAHEKACNEAGPFLCQVLGSSVNSWGEDQVSGNLRLRAEPDWLKTFRGSVASDAEKSGGKLSSNTASAEDLTRNIVDTGARLEAKKTLRTRIKHLLETNEGDLSDILQAERALAEVQGEIDAMTSVLKAMQDRVAMSSLDISYNSDPTTSTSIFKPLGDAFKSFGRTSIASLASAVNFVAAGWPFFIVLLIVLWILRRWLRGRKKA